MTASEKTIEQATDSPRPGNDRIALEPCAKRVRTVFNGVTLADSTAMMLLHEAGHLPVYYFPWVDVRRQYLQRTAHSSRCPYKGQASYWSVQVGDRCAQNALWAYEDPITAAAALRSYAAFYWDRMDAWYEEDEEVFVHARDPYKRIDVVRSARPVRVVLAGETVADTRRALFLFETGLPVRYYIPPQDVRRDCLEPSATRTACPYKGTAGYWSLRLGQERYADLVWTYAEPLAEVAAIKDHLCFFNEKVDDILVDGAAVAKVKTPWSPS